MIEKCSGTGAYGTVAASLAALPRLGFFKSRRQKQVDAAAEQEHARFLAAAESSLNGFFIFESVRDTAGEIVDFRFCYMNANAEKLVRRPRSELIGKLLCVELPIHRTEGCFERYRKVVLTGESLCEEMPISNAQISASWIRHQVVKLGDGIAITTCDLSETKKTKEQYRQLAEFTNSLFENAPFSMIATDTTGLITAVNRAGEGLSQYRREELVGKVRLTELHDPEEMTSRLATMGDSSPDADLFTLFTAKPRRGELEESEWSYVRKDGAKLPVNEAVTAICSTSGEVTGFISITFDITDRKQLIDYVRHLATHDQLTGLIGRALLEDRIAQAIGRAKRYRTKVAVFLLDLDHFKRVNDSLGHSAGDQILREVADRLRHSVRGSDSVGRIGGDEFVVVMPDIENLADAEACAANLVRRVSATSSVGNHSIHMTSSVGWCVYPDFAENSSSLLKGADDAMYAAKENGGDQHQMFSGPLARDNSNRLLLEHALRTVLDRKELLLHYQPQVCFASGRVTGMEALVRWNHPELGLVSPAQFIPLAEETGLIIPIGEWVLRQACREAAWIQAQTATEITLSVNLSPRQLRQKSFLRVISSALEESGFPARNLEIEITESTLMQNSAASAEMLQDIRSLGCRIAIDDFGTGFCSFSYLLEYQVDRLKIDQTFVKKAVTDPNAAAVVRAIIAMSHGLNIKVVAEGVETVEQLRFLLRRKCDEAQGYFFARPASAEEFPAVMETIRLMQSSGWMMEQAPSPA